MPSFDQLRSCHHKAANALRRRERAEAQAARWEAHGPCVRCANFSRAGTNAWQTKTTCLECGNVTIVPRDRPRPTDIPAREAAAQLVVNECPHANVNHQGSANKTFRLYCIDCGTYVHEVPPSEATRQARQMTRRSGGNARAEPRIPEPVNTPLTFDQARDVGKRFGHC